jgi:SAM-dependent methyltransferase
MTFDMNTSGKPSKRELSALASDVVRLSRLLTSGRDALPEAYLRDAGLRRAYRSYFLASNLLKVHAPLTDLSLRPDNAFSRKKLRILDAGSGPGTASLGVVEFFSGRAERPALELTAVDRVGENLREAEALFSGARREAGFSDVFTTLPGDLESAERCVRGTFDVIILSNVLNELFAKDGDRIAKRLALTTDFMTRLLADDGSCIIIEPALRETSRDLIEVRDGMQRQGFTVFSPCLNSGSCPAFAHPRDWCHEDISWDAPALVRELDKLTGLRKDSLKFSYLVLRKDGANLGGLFGADAFRVVSEPLISKGKREFYLCGARGRKLVMRQDKDASASNAAFQEMKRGDIVRLEHPLDEGKRYKVGKEANITLLFQRPLPAEKKRCGA